MEPVLVSALEHWSYCPRQCGLIHVESVWDENVFTLRGTHVHERVDEPIFRTEDGRRVEPALPIWSDDYGLQGRADVVEFLSDGTPVPVEYKSGKARKHKHAELQLCAQALCLEEMFARRVPSGELYFAGSQKRQPIAIGEALRHRTIDAIAAIRTMLASGAVPPPCDDGRCRDCSLADACLPQALIAARSNGSQYRAREEGELP